MVVCLDWLFLMLIRFGVVIEFTVFIMANKTLMRLRAKMTTVALCRLPSWRFLVSCCHPGSAKSS